jgi:transcriptional regulator with XRE-family HTH domain
MISEMKKLRFFAEKTLDNLSVETGIDRATLNRIENGLLRPTARQVPLIAAALNTTSEKLFAEIRGKAD